MQLFGVQSWFSGQDRLQVQRSVTLSVCVFSKKCPHFHVRWFWIITLMVYLYHKIISFWFFICGVRLDMPSGYVAKPNGVFVTENCWNQSFYIKCVVFKVMVHLEYPMDKGHNLMVNPSHSAHFVSMKHFWTYLHTSQSLSSQLFFFLGKKPQNGGGVGRMLMPSKGKLTENFSCHEIFLFLRILYLV